MYPHSSDPNALGVMVLVIAPAVFLVCWLYNAHRLGKFKKVRRMRGNMINGSAKYKRLLVICGAILAALLVMAFYFAF